MNDQANLIERLLTLAGVIMEDASAVAIVVDGAEVGQRISQVLTAADQANTLARAAEVVLQRVAAGVR